MWGPNYIYVSMMLPLYYFVEFVVAVDFCPPVPALVPAVFVYETGTSQSDS